MGGVRGEGVKLVTVSCGWGEGELWVEVRVGYGVTEG